MTITPELQQNIFYTVYFTLAHNFAAILYFGGSICFAVLAVWRPKRSFVLLLLGFMILLFGFEYQKHIEDSLRTQTLNSLITIQEHNQVRRVVNATFVKLIPWGLPLAGWSLVGYGSYLLYTERKKTK